MKRRAPIAALLAGLALADCGGGGEADQPAADRASAEPAAAPPGQPDFASLTGDAARGQELFAQCAICHTVDPGANRLGPSLHGVVGRPAASVAGFAYSPAMRESGVTWSAPELYAYLRDPQGRVPGTSMAFPGLAEPRDRADIIAWLATRR